MVFCVTAGVARVTPGTTPGRVKGGKPACCNPSDPGSKTWPTSGMVIFKFNGLEKGGKPPGKGIKPGGGTPCEKGTWLASGTVGTPVRRLLLIVVGLELTDKPVRDCSNPVDGEEATATGTVGTTAERWTSVKPSIGGGAGSLGVCAEKLIFLPSANGSVGTLCR